MKRVITAMVLLIVLMAGFIGCVTQTQAIKNGTDDVMDMMYVYYRITGTTVWTRSYDSIISIRANDTGEVTLPSSLFKGTENIDMRLESSGRTRGIYTKLNVPFSSDPIVFTAQDRHPILTMRNDTGLPISITILDHEYPIFFDGAGRRYYDKSSKLDDAAIVYWSLPELDQNRSINVAYSVYATNNDTRGAASFTENVELNADVTLTLTKRPPVVTIVNNTGYPVTVSKPYYKPLANGATSVYLKQSETANSFTVTYKVDNVQAQQNQEYNEQITFNNNDVTFSLTKRPPVVTIANNTGNTVNLVFLRNPDTNWPDQNILNLQLKPDGTLDITKQATAQAGERRGSITNREDFRFWLGNVNIKPDRYDIRIDDVQGNSYVKSNVQITSDMTLTFTQSDKR